MFNSLIELYNLLKITPETCPYQTFLHRTEVIITETKASALTTNKLKIFFGEVYFNLTKYRIVFIR